MATIRQTPSKKYRVDWRDSRGKSQSRTFITMADARAHRNAVLGEQASGTLTDAVAARRTVEWWGNEWAKHLTVTPRTEKEYRSKLRLYIVPTLGHRAIREVDRKMCLDFVKELERIGLAAGTIRYAIAVLLQVLEFAKQQGAIRDNPAEKLGAKTPLRREMKFLSADELHHLADSTETLQDKVIILLAGYTGMRAGELFKLRVADIIPEERVVIVRGTKTALSYRRTSYPKKIAGLMSVWLRQLWDAGAVPSSPLFQDTRGGFLDYTNWYMRKFVPAVELAGLRGLRFHDLRHTYVAMSIAVGAPSAGIMQALGHSDIRTTYNVYGHIFPDMAREWADRL